MRDLTKAVLGTEERNRKAWMRSSSIRRIDDELRTFDEDHFWNSLVAFSPSRLSPLTHMKRNSLSSFVESRLRASDLPANLRWDLSILPSHLTCTPAPLARLSPPQPQVQTMTSSSWASGRPPVTPRSPRPPRSNLHPHPISPDHLHKTFCSQDRARRAPHHEWRLPQRCLPPFLSSAWAIPGCLRR